MSNKLTNMAREILAIEDDLIHRINYHTNTKSTINDFELYTFNQLWGSTALGFGGIGGQAMTTARTYVFIPYDTNEQFVHVYFGSRWAYSVPYTESLWEDVKNQRMESVAASGKYFKKIEQ